MKKLSLLGSTGSIGTQTLDIVRNYPNQFQILALSGKSNIELLLKQMDEFKPKYVCVMTEDAVSLLKEKGVKSEILLGPEGLKEIATLPEADQIVISTVGSIGLPPTMAAIEAGKPVALANKEVLVMAGEQVMGRAAEKNVPIFPIDSEHSAILQCLLSGHRKEVERILITASGGPFRNLPLEELENVTLEDALAHPTWSMGQKITIDSATLMNKGLEVIECCHLFDVTVDKVDVVVHPQSLVHSLVEFVDGSYIAQIGPTDMRIPIQYALTYPERLPGNGDRIDLAKIGSLIFEAPTPEKFPCLGLAYEASRKGGTLPVVLSVANEVAVQAFLEKKIKYTDIARVIGLECEEHSIIKQPSLEEILEVEKEIRVKTLERINLK